MTTSVIPVQVVDVLLDCCDAMSIVEVKPNAMGRSISFGVDCLCVKRFMIRDAIGVKLPMTVASVTLIVDRESMSRIIDATSNSDASWISFGSLNILGNQ